MKQAKKPLMSTLDEKIFFVIKYWIMSVFQGAAIIVVVFFLGTVDALGLILLGIIFFLVALIISKYFDKNISALAFWATKKLDNYPKVKNRLAKSI